MFGYVRLQKADGKNPSPTKNGGSPFTNSSEKAEIFEAIASSLRTRKVLAKTRLVKTPEEVEEMTSLRALAADISESMENIKTSKSKDDKAAYSAFKGLTFGQNVSKCKARKSLSKLVNVGRTSVSSGIIERAKILSGESPIQVRICYNE